jgi:hypothetical protein
VIQWVFITLDGEDIVSESLDSSTDLVHRESVCSKVNPAGVLWEDEVHSTSEHTVLHSPITQRISLVEGEIVIKIAQLKVKCVLVGLCVLADVVHEVSTPFRVLDVFLKEFLDVFIRPGLEVNLSQCVDISLNFLECLVISLVSRCRVNCENTGNSFSVIATDS